MAQSFKPVVGSVKIGTPDYSNLREGIADLGTGIAGMIAQRRKLEDQLNLAYGKAMPWLGTEPWQENLGGGLDRTAVPGQGAMSASIAKRPVSVPQASEPTNVYYGPQGQIVPTPDIATRRMFRRGEKLSRGEKMQVLGQLGTVREPDVYREPAKRVAGAGGRGAGYADRAMPSDLRTHVTRAASAYNAAASLLDKLETKDVNGNKLATQIVGKFDKQYRRVVSLLPSWSELSAIFDSETPDVDIEEVRRSVRRGLGAEVAADTLMDQFVWDVVRFYASSRASDRDEVKLKRIFDAFQRGDIATVYAVIDTSIEHIRRGAELPVASAQWYKTYAVPAPGTKRSAHDIYESAYKRYEKAREATGVFDDGGAPAMSLPAPTPAGNAPVADEPGVIQSSGQMPPGGGVIERVPLTAGGTTIQPDEVRQFNDGKGGIVKKKYLGMLNGKPKWGAP